MSDRKEKTLQLQPLTETKPLPQKKPLFAKIPVPADPPLAIDPEKFKYIMEVHHLVH